MTRKATTTILFYIGLLSGLFILSGLVVPLTTRAQTVRYAIPPGGLPALAGLPATGPTKAYQPPTAAVRSQRLAACAATYSFDLDEDGDGYSNADELDNKTDPCAAASKPRDHDQDLISDRNDSDDDNDGISDEKDYFALDAHNGLTTRLPINYEFLNHDPGTGLFGLGFTGLMSNGVTNYASLLQEGNVLIGDISGTFSVLKVGQGDALGTRNTQQQGFQFGLDVDAGTGPFTVQARMLAPFFNGTKPQNYSSQGIYIGTGDQGNYLKVVFNAINGQGGIEVVLEQAGQVTSNQYALVSGWPGKSVELYLAVDPAAGTVQPKYGQDGGAVQNLGSPLVLSGALLEVVQKDPALAVGLIATTQETETFTATWDFIQLTADEAAMAIGSWTSLSPASGGPIGRHESAYVQAGDRFYLLGGRGIKAVQAYDPVKKNWANKANTPLEFHHLQAVTHNGLIYVAGAFTGGYPREKPVPNVYIYNPLTDKWIKGASIPVNRRRGSAGVVVYNNKIYLVGGIIDGHWTGHVAWLDEYDPATNTWKKLPDAPRARDHFQAAVLGGKIYVAGGRRSSASTGEVFQLTVPEVDVFDFATGTWTTLPAASNLPTQRAGTASAVLGGELLIIGGESSQAAAHNEAEALNQANHTWRKLANLNQGRHATQAIVNNKGIYIVAGSGKQGGWPELTSQEVFFMTGSEPPQVTSIAPGSLAAPQTLNFNDLVVGTSKTETITLTNQGSSQGLVITSLALTGAPEFTAQAPFPLPFVIPPGGSVSVQVSFAPPAEASYSATLTVNHSATAGSNAIALSGKGISPPVSMQEPIRVNAGGNALTTAAGDFVADTYFSPVPGLTSSHSGEIAGTQEDALYQSGRMAETENGSFSYAIPVSTGKYKLVLHFAELSWTAIGQRIFDVKAEGSLVRDNFDIIRKAGADFTATTDTILVDVTDAVLNLQFSALAAEGGVDRPLVSAIEVLSIPNQRPLANAGADKTITLPTNSVVLSGSGADADGTVASYQWTKQSGPSATLSNANTATLTAGDLVAGSYVFRLTVTDNQGATGFDEVLVTVKDASNSQQVVSFTLINTATNEEIRTLVSGETLNLATLPAKNLNIRANTNPETVGSVKFALSGAQSKNATESGAPYALFGDSGGKYYSWAPATGNYSLTATPYTNSGGGGTAGTPLTITFQVVDQATNAAPVANAGADKAITLPTNSVVLSGSGSDPDGSISAYSWSQISGPAEAALTNANTATLTAGDLVAGSYVFRLTVTDNVQASASDEVTVTVYPELSGNQAPVANAGADQTITLPTNSISVSGSGTDADGTIASYEWTQQSGPSATLTNTNTATLTAGDLVAGSYVFRLTVTDNQGATGFDEVMVTVKDASNSQQVASFTLINTATNEEIRTLVSGEILNLATLPAKEINIRANTNPEIVGSVKFALSGAQSKNTTESAAPYALFGDSGGKYYSWAPATGNYSLTATPYTNSGGGGTAGTPLTITFQVVDEAPAARLVIPNSESALLSSEIMVFPNPVRDGKLQVALPRPVKGEIAFELSAATGMVIAKGKLILSRPTSVLDLNFSRQMQNRGMYLLKLTGKNLNTLLKVIRE